MPVNTESLNRKLFNVLARYKPKPLDVDGERADIEDVADVFKFTFSKDGKDYGDVYATIDDKHNLNLYYDDAVTECPSEPTPGLDYDDTWTGFIQFMKQWAFRNRLGWHPENNKDHLVRDMARRKYMKKQENISEGYYAMGKKASYSDAVPSVKIVIEHTRQIEEGEQRYRNVNRIFLENQAGERFLLDTKQPGIARVYARHIAEGGVPNDERWNHIKGLCEEYKKMAGFVRATRGGQFNESAQKLVESGIAHYQSLRESLSKMTGKRGYNTYFESWTPPLMEDDSDTSNLNELFVEESLDPRIESVMPILSKLQKKVSEMKEVDALAEWADSIDRPQGDANKTAEKVLSQFPMQLGEEESLTSNNPVGIPETSGSGLDAILARYPEAVEDFKQGGEIDYDLESDLWDYYFNNGDIRNYDADASEYIGQQLADYLGVNEGIIDTIKKGVKKGLEKVGGGSDIDQLKRLQKNMGIPKSAQHGKPAMAKSKEQGVAEGFQSTTCPKHGTYEFHGKHVPPCPQCGYPEAKTRDEYYKSMNAEKYGKEQGVAEGLPQTLRKVVPGHAKREIDKKMDAGKFGKTDADKDANFQRYKKIQDKIKEQGVAEEVDTGQYDARKSNAKGATTPDQEKSFREKIKQYSKELEQRQKQKEQGVAEGLDANQKRVGQLGPTEKVKNNNIGKLVGANENFINTVDQAVVTEMDSEGYKGSRDDANEIGKGKESYGKAMKAKDASKKFGKELDKQFDKANDDKKEVKEGQEEFDAMMRILKK